MLHDNNALLGPYNNADHMNTLSGAIAFGNWYFARKNRNTEKSFHSMKSRLSAWIMESLITYEASLNRSFSGAEQQVHNVDNGHWENLLLNPFTLNIHPIGIYAYHIFSWSSSFLPS